MNNTIKVSLIITTYNWKDALSLVLKSITQQSRLPDEVIIADDGSNDGTTEMLNKLKNTFPVPLIHSWQEDNGFQVAKSRNKAVAKTSGDYIVIIDGDMILTPKFIESHIKFAKKSQFIQGTRVPTSKVGGEKILIQKEINLNFYSRGIRHRNHSIHNYFLSNIFSKIRNNGDSIRACNMSFWKSDLIDCNGFNEDFVGWGREDTEITHRLYNNGKQRLYLRFAAVAFHIYHNEKDRQSQDSHQEILNNTINNRVTRCQNGIDKYL